MFAYLSQVGCANMTQWAQLSQDTSCTVCHATGPIILGILPTSVTRTICWGPIFNPRQMLLEFQMWATLCIDPAATTTTTTIHYNHISVNLDWFPSSSLILSSTESWWSNFFRTVLFHRECCAINNLGLNLLLDNHNDDNGWLFNVELPGFVCASVWNKSIMFNTRVSMEVGK